MSLILVRIELNDPQTGDYEMLYEAMYNRSIYRVAQVGDGIWRDLPTGSFSTTAYDTKEEVYSQVLHALNHIGKFNIGLRRDYELVVGDTGNAYTGLRMTTDTSKLPPYA